MSEVPLYASKKTIYRNPTAISPPSKLFRLQACDALVSPSAMGSEPCYLIPEPQTPRSPAGPSTPNPKPHDPRP